MAKQSQDVAAKPKQMMRRGHPVYRENPSLVDAAFPTRITQTHSGKVNGYMMAPGTGEVIGQGAFAFVKEKIVDSEEFVKIYLAGIRKYGELSKAGALLFEFVYREISGRGAKDKDTVAINYMLTKEWQPDLSRRTYDRGMSELLEKGFIYRTVAADTYFVNIRFMFNGNRLALVEDYVRKGTATQADLPFVEPPALPAPEAS